MTEKVKQKIGAPIIDKGEISLEQMDEVEMGKYYTVAQIATKLCYTQAYILKLLKLGRIKGIKPLGGRWRVPNSEYERIIQEGIPPMPREEKEKPPVTTIEVSETVIDKIKEPEKKKEPPLAFPWSLFGEGKQ